MSELALAFLKSGKLIDSFWLIINRVKRNKNVSYLCDFESNLGFEKQFQAIKILGVVLLGFYSPAYISYNVMQINSLFHLFFYTLYQ